LIPDATSKAWIRRWKHCGGGTSRRRYPGQRSNRERHPRRVRCLSRM